MTNMKRLLMLPVIAIMPLVSFAQNWNPWVNSGTISPTPLLSVELNGTGILSFNVGNSGSDVLTAGAAANQKLKLIITLSNGIPDNANPLAAVSGTMASKFSWVYDAAQKTYTAIQTQPLAGLDAGTILIAYKVTQNSTAEALANGFNVNLTAPAYASLSNSQPDDNTSSYTNTTGTPLPVEMGVFTAVAEQERARLDWTTFSENDNTGFEIQRSADSKSWKKIGFENSKAENGNSIQMLQYVAYDEQPVQGLNTYRLLQTDKNGRIVYSQVRQVSFSNEGSIRIYPNPVTDLVYIRTNNLADIQEIRVSDATGRLLFLVKDATQGISMVHLAKATYLLQVVKKDGGVSSFKIIKN